MGLDELGQTAMPTEEDADDLASLERVAPGDIVPPWRPLDASGLLGLQDRRSVLAEVRVALVDGATARYGERCRMLVGRARRLGRRVRAQLADAHRAPVPLGHTGGGTLRDDLALLAIRVTDGSD
jgi:hypothetical protein